MEPFSISGHIVAYIEHRALWEWRDGDGNSVLTDPQLSPIRAAIEKHEAKQAKFVKEKFATWEAVLSDWGSLKRVTITSEADNGQVWVRHPDKRRTKEKLRDLRKIDPQTEGLVAKYETLQVEIDERQAA